MPARDVFASHGASLESPLSHAVEVVPDDTGDLTHVSRALHLGMPGDLRVTMRSGQTATFRNLSSGWHPLRVSRVHATGTTAIDIVAGW